MLTEAPDLDGPAAFANPYPRYSELRRRAPVRWHEPWQAWVVTGYDTAVAALQHPSLSSRRVESRFDRLGPDERAHCAALIDLTSRWSLYADPPEHAAIRRSVTRALSAEAVDALADTVARTAGRLLDTGTRGGRLDVVAALAEPLPVHLIVEVLGLPSSSAARMAARTDAVMGWISDPLTPGTAQAAQEAASSIRDELSRSAGGSSVHERLAAECGRAGLTAEDALANTVMLLVGGHRTTTAMIGNCVLALASRPGCWRRLLRGEVAVADAVEELLRYDSPSHRTGRVAREDLELGGAAIGRGDYVSVVLAAANRDPDAFDAPDTVVLDRRPNRHVAFGYGRHFCVGARLARLQTAAVIRALLGRSDRLRLAADGWEPEWVGTYNARSLRSLVVEL